MIHINIRIEISNVTRINTTNLMFDRSPNLILPIEVLNELQAEGMVGPSCEYHYSFMGHIEEPHLTTLIQKSSVEVAKEIRQHKADIALLVPA